MHGSPPSGRLGAAALAVLAVGCGRACVPQPPGAAGAFALEPPPPPPPVSVAPEVLPGAGDVLAVIAARPQGPVSGEVRPTVAFSRPVAALGAEEAPAFRIEPNVAGRWRWLGSATAEFVPEGRLPLGTAFTVTVPAGLRAVDGAGLAEPFAFAFETARPAVLEVRPEPGWRWLRPDEALSIVLDQPVKDLAARLGLEAAGREVPFSVRAFRVADEERADPVRRRGPGPPAAGAGGRDDRRTRYEVRPRAPLPRDAEVVLRVNGPIASAEGTLALEGTPSWTFRTYGPFRVVSVRACGGGGPCPPGAARLETTNPIDAATLKAAVTFTPDARVDWDAAAASGAAVSLPADLRPGTRYAVAVGSALRDAFGQPLEAPAKVELRTEDVEPALDGGRSLELLEAGGDGTFPLEVTNVSSLEVRLAPLDAPALARLLSGAVAGPSGAPSGAAARTLDTSAPRNVRRAVPVPVRELLGRETGLFAATVEAPALRAAGPDRPWTWRREVVGQLTDVAVHAKLGAASGAVWVTRLSDGRPLPGASIALHDRAGGVRWTGIADADGLARVPGLAALLGGADARWPGEAPFALVSARVGADMGVTLSAAGGLDAAAFGVPADWDGGEPRAVGGAFTERAVYRPGETVHVKGLLRASRLGELTTPRSGPVSVRVASARGREILAARVALGRYGTWAADVPVPADAPLGTYEVRALAATDAGELEQRASFRVEDDRAPPLQVEVVAGGERTAGDPMRAQVRVRLPFGAGRPGAAVRWTLTREAGELDPPRGAGFTFGPIAAGGEGGAPSRAADLVAAGEGETDAQGILSVDAGPAEAPAGRTWVYALEAEVAEAGRPRLVARGSFTVHPASLYAGLRRRSAGFAQAGRPDVLQVVAVTPGGARRAGVRVSLELVRRGWRPIRRQAAGGGWLAGSEALGERAGACEVETAAPSAECTFTPPGPGLYVAEATLVDERGRRQTTRLAFHAVGAGPASWERDDGGRIDLVPDRALYAPGDVARVLVKSPFEEAEAMVTVEREGVLSARRVSLAGAAPTIDVPIGEEAVPNVFVSVVAVRRRTAPASGGDPAEAGGPGVRVGYARLEVESRSRRLEVAVLPDGTGTRPRDRLPVALEVRDARGRAVDAEVTVWAVDEGALQPGVREVPDPVELLHPPRALSVRIGEPLVLPVERRSGREEGATEGERGGGEAGVAAAPSPLAARLPFVAAVRTGPDGRARVQLELPDAPAALRLVAVAVAGDDRSGSGQAKVQASARLTALPAAPALVRAGDRFDAGVVVHAPGGAARDVEVRAVGEGLALLGEPVRTVRLEGGRPREVRFPFRAERPGAARLRFAVTGGGERDAVERLLRVELPVSTVAVAVHGATTAARREALALPGGVRTDAGGLELSLASTSLGGFAEGLRQLVAAPYGGLEQLSSRLVPFLALRELHAGPGAPGAARSGSAATAWLEPASLGGARDPDDLVDRTVKAVEALQGADGGYRSWAGAPCSAEWASSYAVLALGRSAGQGYPVDREALRRGQAYLAETVAAGRCTRCGTSCPAPWDATRVFALYALARTGAARPSFHAELLARRQALPLFARAMLADAMLRGAGDREGARKVLQEVLDQGRETPSEVHLEEPDGATYAPLWSSDVRTTAIALSALAALDPDHPHVARMAAWLGNRRRGDGTFRSTQEAAFAVLALAEVARAREGDAPDFVARAALAGKEFAAVPFRGRSAEVLTERVPAASLPAAGGSVALDLVRDGAAGTLHYEALLRFAPASMPVEPLERGLFVQRWFEPYGGGGQVHGARAGDLVRVRVRVATAQERHFVAVSVPLPAGLEIVDTSLASAPPVVEPRPRSPEGEPPDEELGEEDGGEAAPDPEPWAFRFWSPFDHELRGEARLVLFADDLLPGIHLATFVARATTPGDFVLVPAEAEEIYAPEVSGRSDGGTFRVATGEERAAR